MKLPSPTRRAGRKAWLIRAARLTVSVALLFWIISRANLADIFAALADTQILWLTCAACLPAVSVLIKSVRWGGLLRALGVRIRLALLVESCLVAGFAGHFLPSTIGGDMVRGCDSWRLGSSKSEAVAALVVERILGLLVLVLFAVGALCFPHELTREYPSVYVWVCSAAAGLLLAVWFVFQPARLLSGAARALAWSPAWIRRGAGKLLQAATAYQGMSRPLGWAFLFSVLLQINVVTFYWFISKAMGFPIAYEQFYLIVPIAIFVMLVPVSINAIGIREGIFVFLLGTYGIDTAEALAFAWLEHGLFLLYGLLGGIVFALRQSPAAETQPASPRTAADSV